MHSPLKIRKLEHTHHSRQKRTISNGRHTLLKCAGPANSQPSSTAAGEEPLKPRTVKPIAVARPAAMASGLGRMLASRRGTASNAAQLPQVQSHLTPGPSVVKSLANLSHHELMTRSLIVTTLTRTPSSKLRLRYIALQGPKVKSVVRPSAAAVREVTLSGGSLPGVGSVPRATTAAGTLVPDPAAGSPQPHTPAAAEVLPTVAASEPPGTDAPGLTVSREVEAAYLSESRREAIGSDGTADAGRSAAGSLAAASELHRSPAVAAPDDEQGHGGQRLKARSAFAAAMAGSGQRKSGQVQMRLTVVPASARPLRSALVAPNLNACSMLAPGWPVWTDCSLAHLTFALLCM